MSSMEKNSTAMTSSVMTSLSHSFRQVPPTAIPAFLDCFLSSTCVSPSTLVGSLIEDFPNLLEDLTKREGKLDPACSNYIASFVAGLCHLLEKFGDNHNALQLFMWRVFIPLMKVVRAYELEMLNRILESFFDVVIKANAWDMLETNLAPFLLRSIGISAGMLQQEETDVIKWGEFSAPHGQIAMKMDEEYILSLSRSLPLPLSCHLLTLALEAAFQNLQSDPVVENFTANLLWDLCNMTERLLLQSVEHRSCAVGFLLTSIFKVFASKCSLKISLHGKTYALARSSFLKKIWGCCKKLFSVGSLERRDAYSVLSLCLSSVCCKGGNESGFQENEAAEFDFRSEQVFWDEIKKGLVDDESLVRKQSLHILKSILCISEASQSHSSIPEKKPKQRHSVPHGMTKREMWARKEAKSLGVGKLYSSADSGLTIRQQWEAFLLLYEMLEEYGTHLIEAAWSNQVNLLLESSFTDNTSLNFPNEHSHQGHVETINEATEVFNWLSVLWSRGFRHDNPLVRSMIMESFLGIEWGRYGTCSKSMPESFVLGPFMEGLNDPVHHKDFGLKGIYSSRTVDGAACFLCAYTSFLDPRHQVKLLINLASVARKQSFGRAGLMGLVECIASSAHVIGERIDKGMDHLKVDFSKKVQVESCNGHVTQDDMVHLLDVLKFVMESSKQHFNPKYRIKVYQKVLEAAASVVDSCDVPLGILLQFVSAIPREFTGYNGSLRQIMREWLQRRHDKNSNKSSPRNDICLMESLHEYLEGFISNDAESCDDEDMDAWEFQTKRWARVLFLIINSEQDLTHIVTFIQNHGVNICEQNKSNHLAPAPLKFLILILSMLTELQSMKEGLTELSAKGKDNSCIGSSKKTEKWAIANAPVIREKFAGVFLSILKELVSFAESSCSIFWSPIAVENGNLPGSVRGKLGGPSQRRLSVPSTTAVLQAVTSVKTVASVVSYCAQLKTDVQLKLASTFLWKFFHQSVSPQVCNSEAEAEIYLAAFEALASVLKAFVSLCSAQAFDLFESNNTLLKMVDGKPWLEVSVLTFQQSINNLLAMGLLVRTRRAVLLNWKWLCMESLLSVTHHCLHAKHILEDRRPFLSNGTLIGIFSDINESLENAGEDSVLPILRSVRLTLELLASLNVDIQMIWRLVNSCWILHISCNKRRVAPIAALLSSVLHSSLFSNKEMHVTDEGLGPLKWFVAKVLEEGQKSPRTIRLAALHLTGLCLLFPWTIKLYIKELRLLTLYGSVAFDEDFEAELSDNNDARVEVSLLAKSPDPELTEVFINTELYARVSVAVLFHELANSANRMEPACQNQDYQDAFESGKLFLLELLDSVVHDKDLAKELYKKYSGIHRRKIRAWQMICILSRFVGHDIVGQVTESLHICLCRNNLPAVRQYIETFAINIYLEFPSLVDKQLVRILQNYDMKPQALSSYVFIAANVILHAPKAVQHKHLDVLLPPIIPLLTSHHHSLRGFTQLLVHQVLFKMFPHVDYMSSQSLPLEKRSFENLKSYLDNNPDCARLRSSMEGYLDAYSPNTAATPAGVFVNRVEENEFECVPTCLMDDVIAFLNNVREDLRTSMAKDIVTIKNEGLKLAEDPTSTMIMTPSAEDRLIESSRDLPLDFQKKITLSKLEKQDASSSSVLGNKETYERLLEMEKEDELFNQLLRSRSMEVERLKAGRQSLLLVASLLDRIPNLAGLARTCEVFKASGLAVADANIVHDKQFQLISVTAEKWVPIIEVPVNSLKQFLERKKREGFSILGLEQTANSIPLDKYTFPAKTVLVLGREKEGIPVDIIHMLDACIEIPQLGVVRSLNVHVSGAIALWEYTRQQRT